MKIGVLGAGLMGKEIARDLALSSGVSVVGLADIDKSQAEQICKELDSVKLKAYGVDASDNADLAKYMKQFDVIVNALFYTFNERVVQTAIQVKVHVVDLGGHIGDVTAKVLALSKEAAAADITIIPDLGVAPGMINILSGHGVGQLDAVTSIKLYVGGIPLRPAQPLEYNHVFSMEGVLDHYTDPSFIIRNHKQEKIASLSEIEAIYFDKFGPLEAFHTSGGTSTIGTSYPDLATLEYKTIRYPGHASKFQLLVDLNLTKREYTVDVDGQKIHPRDVLLEVLDPIVELGDKVDAVLLRVIVEGLKENSSKTYTYEMMTYREKGITAMARATANTISVVAQMIGNNTIRKRGVYPPEQIVPGNAYIKEMEKRGVQITETFEEDS